MTRARELGEVGEGLAVGCLSIGVVGVTGSKLPLEFAFGWAWRSWTSAGRFRHVRADFDRNDIMRLLGKADRRQAWIATWVVDDGLWAPRLRHPRELEEAAELLTHHGCTLREWESLATDLCGDLGAEHVKRAGATT